MSNILITYAPMATNGLDTDLDTDLDPLNDFWKQRLAAFGELPPITDQEAFDLWYAIREAVCAATIFRRLVRKYGSRQIAVLVSRITQDALGKRSRAAANAVDDELTRMIRRLDHRSISFKG